MSGIRIRISAVHSSFSVYLAHQLHSKQTLACAHMGEEAGIEMVNSSLYKAAPGINFPCFCFPLQNLRLHFLTLVFDSFWPVSILGLNFWLVLTLRCFGWLVSPADGELVNPYTKSCLVCEHPQCSVCTCALPLFLHGPSQPSRGISESFLVHGQGVSLLLYKCSFSAEPLESATKF